MSNLKLAQVFYNFIILLIINYMFIQAMELLLMEKKEFGLMKIYKIKVILLLMIKHMNRDLFLLLIQKNLMLDYNIFNKFIFKIIID